jgi:DNA-binding transcriptional regulator/RsmH inhibitor MraZ
VSLPADFRDAIEQDGGNFLITRAQSIPFLTVVKEEPITRDDEKDEKRKTAHLKGYLKYDDSGRIVLREDFQNALGVKGGEKLVFVGCMDTFQIWTVSGWKDKEERQLQKIAQARQPE